MTDRETGPLPWPLRVRLWDAVLEAVRGCLRDRGLREVTTPVRVGAPAIEPYIEPIASPPGYLATSPELAMKRLVCRGAGSIFQVAHVFRASERGRLHSEEFHLVEWYRVGETEDAVASDVEAIVDVVFSAVASVCGRRSVAPRRWERRGILELLEATTGLQLRGDEGAEELRARVEGVDASLCPPPVFPLDGLTADSGREPSLDSSLDSSLEQGLAADVATLEAWTALFSHWSDRHFDPWLEARDVEIGLHVVEFPTALAALSQLELAEITPGRGTLARRFESHVAGVELANGYRELRDAVEQRRRFDVVSGLRAASGLAPLPMDDDFLADLRAPGLPECSGCALGLDRLVLIAVGARSLDDVGTLLGRPDSSGD